MINIRSLSLFTQNKLIKDSVRLWVARLQRTALSCDFLATDRRNCKKKLLRIMQLFVKCWRGEKCAKKTWRSHGWLCVTRTRRAPGCEVRVLLSGHAAVGSYVAEERALTDAASECYWIKTSTFSTVTSSAKSRLGRPLKKVKDFWSKSPNVLCNCHPNYYWKVRLEKTLRSPLI